MKLPVGKFSLPEVRLVKWMFTFVFVTPDGEKAVDGLIYSPDKRNKQIIDYYTMKKLFYYYACYSAQQPMPKRR